MLARARRKAAAERRTLTSLIEDGLRIVVAENKPRTQPKRILPPISKATGGLLPGHDLTDLSALQEWEDLADFGRTRRRK